MNLVKRLRNRETVDIQQKFEYTQGILTALAQEPKVVIPVSRQAVTEIETLKRAIEAFFLRYSLQPSLEYQKVRLFNIAETEVLHYKCYVLLYTPKHTKLDVQFNLTHIIQFTQDLLLQVGRPGPD